MDVQRMHPMSRPTFTVLVTYSHPPCTSACIAFIIRNAAGKLSIVPECGMGVLLIVDLSNPRSTPLAVSRKWWKFEDGVISG